MNEQLQQALTELITKATTGIDSASEFILAEMPEVIQQLILWHGIYNLTLFVLGILWFISSAIIIKIVFSRVRVKVLDDMFDHVLFFLISGMLCGFPTIAICNLEWLKIWLAPKVWLIEYAANLVK